MTFRVGFVTGATPDKWARVWRTRSREGLALVPTEQAAQLDGLRSGEHDMALARLPIDRDGLHCIPLYDERPVVVVGTGHFITATDPGDEVTLADLADEQLVAPHASGWVPDADQLDWPAMSLREAVETVAAGTGIAVMPLAVARLHARKDVTHRIVADLPDTTVGLVWAETNEDPRVQTFIGIVRGRGERSSR